MTTQLKSTQVTHAGVSLATYLESVPSIAISASSTYDPPAIAAGDTILQNFAITGAQVGDFVQVSFSQALAGCLMQGQITAVNTLTLTIHNPGAGSVNIVSGTLKVRLTRSA